MNRKYRSLDLLTIQDKEERIAVAEGLLKNADNSRRLLISAYLELAEKNKRPDYKLHSNFLKIFPQFFQSYTTSVSDLH